MRHREEWYSRCLCLWQFQINLKCRLAAIRNGNRQRRNRFVLLRNLSSGILRNFDSLKHSDSGSQILRNFQLYDDSVVSRNRPIRATELVFAVDE